jgi:spermidine synthase
LNEIQQLEIVIDDAFEFVLGQKKYTFVIDVFQDTKMPNFLYENYFINRICLLLKSKGFVLFNTMLLNEEHNLRNKKYISDFTLITPLKIPVEIHNELIVIEKSLN